MPRQKTISTEKLIELFNEYHAEYPRTHFKSSNFGKYLRDKGYEISDKSIRRNTEFREYVATVCDPEANTEISRIVFANLDPESFIEHNNSKDKMKRALRERDQYYANVAATANEAIQNRKELESSNEKLEKEKRTLSMKCEKLKKQLEDTKELLDEQSKKAEMANAASKKMADFIKGYVYPDTANMFFQREGILDYVSSLMTESTLESKLVTRRDRVADDDQSGDSESGTGSRFESVNALLGGFDDD